MSIVAAFLVPGLPHILAKPDVAPWGRLADAAAAAGEALKAAKPDAVVVYSTQWIAVLDQLWQTKPHLKGSHVDENWYEWGDIPYDIHIDTGFTEHCIAKGAAAGIRSKGVNYDGFPVDTGTLVAQHFLNPSHVLPLVVTSNNVYHDWAKTERLGQLVRDVAEADHKRIVVVGVGGLSARMFRSPIDPATDHFAEAADDQANRRLLALAEHGDVEGLRNAAAEAAGAGPTDFGLKHLAFLIGALGGKWSGADVRGYGPIYGTGAAVVEIRP